MSSVSFLLEFLKTPGRIGAVSASSSRLAREITSGIDLESAAAVLEYGAGTGAFTGRILAALRRDALFVAFEANPRFAARLRQRYPTRPEVIEDSVENAGPILKARGIERVDCIISGLPWAHFSTARQESLLQTTSSLLAAGGRFATFAYIHGLLLPTGARFRQLLPRYFSRVTTSGLVWGNLPPAFVYRCRK